MIAPPLASVPATSAYPQAPAGVPPRRVGVRPTLLVIEDDPTDRDMVLEILKQMDYLGFELDTAPTLTDALRRIAEGDVGIALVDLMLPDTGPAEEAISQIRRSSDRLPIVVCTGYGHRGHIERFVRCGADAFVAKDDLSERVLEIAIETAIHVRGRLVEARILFGGPASGKVRPPHRVPGAPKEEPRSLRFRTPEKT